MKGSYNAIASFYDNLSKLIFRNAIKNSQKILINSINKKENILIIGGGTGWILEEIATKQKSGLQITYIDISEKMISLAKKRNAGDNKIYFINNSILNAVFTTQYDVVITPFILDNFSEKNIEIIIDKINNCLAPNGLWLYADFQIHNNSLWQKLMLKIMYFFFRITCNIEASKLIETKPKFKKRGFKIISSKNFYSNFISSIVYQKI